MRARKTLSGHVQLDIKKPPGSLLFGQSER
jgi:hypothetical protein